MAQESKLEAKLVKAVKNNGGIALKFISPNYDGLPDRLVLIAYGHVGFVEVKAPNKKPRPLQLARHKQLRKLGFKVYVLDDEKQILEIINDIKGGDGDEL